MFRTHNGRRRPPPAVRRDGMIIYIGPDQVMPVSTVLGTAVGLLLLFWNKAVALFYRITGRPIEKDGSAEPAAPAAQASAAEEPRHQ